LQDTGYAPWQLFGFALMRGATTCALWRPLTTWGVTAYRATTIQPPC